MNAPWRSCDTPWTSATRDEAAEAIIAANAPVDSVFDIPQVKVTAPLGITGFGSFVTIQAAGSDVLRDITALRFIAGPT